MLTDFDRLHELADYLVSAIETMKIQPTDFIEVIIHAGPSGLSENTRFKTWMIQYIAKNLDGPTLQAAVEEVNSRGNPEFWRVWEFLASSLRYLTDELEKARRAELGLPTPESSPAPKKRWADGHSL